ncbi:hypothetical protein [Sediminibacillus albus]|uniref:Uncharacterized protein n=1 Tax=Sediminibacillus albus TaxID=407036 RepID=A0A1G8WD16_9BACI|nr:hypothetical protein [Sediminibacillus albus]SDJ76144.1 hypothetical protein SAMN05216243_0713 [Sediminibacillus albus]
MFKKTLLVAAIMAVIGAAAAYWLAETSSAKLAEPVKVNEQADDFIIHVQVEKKDKGFQVLRSLEYIGEEPVELLHRTPLISLDVNREMNDFTGSPVTKELDPGDVYHPQDPKLFKPLDKGTHTLYITCEFYLNGELKSIQTEKEMVFE